MAYCCCSYEPYGLYITKVRAVNVFSAQGFQWVFSAKVVDIHGGDFKKQGEESVQFGNLRFWHAPGHFAARMRVSNTTCEAVKLCGNTVNLLPPAWESVTARSKRS